MRLGKHALSFAGVHAARDVTVIFLRLQVTLTSTDRSIARRFPFRTVRPPGPARRAGGFREP